MDFRENWYKDEDVKELIKQIHKVMKKYEITKMRFENNEDIERYFSKVTGIMTECKIKNGYSMSGFHLEFNEGRIQINL